MPLFRTLGVGRFFILRELLFGSIIWGTSADTSGARDIFSAASSPCLKFGKGWNAIYTASNCKNVPPLVILAEGKALDRGRVKVQAVLSKYVRALTEAEPDSCTLARNCWFSIRLKCCCAVSIASTIICLI